jgi:hypothetical protein
VVPPRAIAPPGGQSLADPAAVDAWRLVVSRLSGSDGKGFALSHGSSIGRVMAYLAAIAADLMIARAREGGAATTGEAMARALSEAQERLLDAGSPRRAALTGDGEV